MPQQTTTNRTAASVMDASAALYNDAAKVVLTYDAQLPFLKTAVDELQEHMQLANMQITEDVSDIITVNAGVTEIKPKIDAGGINADPTYPANLIEIQKLWVRLAGSSDPYIPVDRVDYLDRLLDGVALDSIIQWTFQDNKIKFQPCNLDMEVRLDYIKSIFPAPLTENSIIPIINGHTFLSFRVAALCSEFIGENPSRADKLNSYALMAVERLTGINVKGQQGHGVRRQPFMGRYKMRSSF